MTFEEALEVVQGLPGRMVDASLLIPDDGGEGRAVMSLSGVVRGIRRSGTAEHWYVLLEHEGASWNFFALDRATFEGAEVKGSGRTLEEVVAEDDETGTTWEITLRHVGAITDVLVYV